MNMNKQGRISPNLPKPRKEPKHWSQRVSECIVSAGPEGNLNLTIRGGADNGQFCWLGEIRHDKVHYHSGKLHQDDIILEIQGQKVAGYTLRDLESWLGQVSKNAAPVMFKTVRSGKVSSDIPRSLKFWICNRQHMHKVCFNDFLYTASDLVNCQYGLHG